jgi:hypothetical protein
MIREMCGPTARIVLDSQGRRLMVYASSNDHARIEQVLSKANVPARNIRVDVATTESGTDAETGGGISGSGNVVIGSGGTRGNVRLTPHIENRSTRIESSSSQTLTMQSGSESVLYVGQDVPHLDWLMDYGVRCGYMQQRTAWRRVGAYLRVKATAIGDGSTVALRIVPEISGMAGDRAAHGRVVNVATEGTGKNGQTVELGGLNENRDFYSRFLVGMDRQGHSRQLRIVATPHVLE